MPSAAASDAELVQETLAGNRDAFGRIVTRYQSLICSLAYSSTGDLGKSEDLAQETFVAAWKQLKALREPEKLKSWLCGIVRNLTSGARRRDGREPSHRAEELTAAAEPAAAEPLPADQAVSREEAALLWNSLERIPELYREPLILFYREHQSIEQVAAGLDLTEDAVKQRLSRGRKLLQDQMLSVIEGTLGRTAPSAVFTASVMGALPIATAGAGMGMGALKGASTKGAWLLLSTIVLGPAVGVLSFVMGYRLEMAEAQSEEERGLIRRFAVRIWSLILVMTLAPAAFCLWGRGLIHGHYEMLPRIICGFAGCYLGALGALFLLGARDRRRLAAAGLLRGARKAPAAATTEFRSRAALFGVPLVHMVWTRRSGERRPPAFGWIACGNQAYGLLAAFGSVAVAPVCFGALSVGFVSWGCCGLGLFAFGAVAIGFWAAGCIALGWNATGGMALGANLAQGGVASGGHFARGALWFAPHHSPAEWAALALQADRFGSSFNLMFQVLGLVALVGIILYWRFVLRHRRLRSAG